MVMRPRRRPIAAASVRVDAPSLPKMELMWNFMVWAGSVAWRQRHLA